MTMLKASSQPCERVAAVEILKRRAEGTERAGDKNVPGICQFEECGELAPLHYSGRNACGPSVLALAP